MIVHERIRARRRFVVGTLLSCLDWLPSRIAFGQTVSGPMQRTALVMGNGAYAFGRLRNPVNDVRAVAGALKTIGFEAVMVEDGGLAHMLDAMKEFIARSTDSGVRLFFYAGHGIQTKGQNYLVPVDATVIEESKLSTQLVSVSGFIDKLTLLKNGANIVILDACRTGLPAAASRRRGVDNKRSLQSGLAKMEAPQGTLIAFSTAPGSVALDGTTQNSTYTRHLLESMNVPGLPVEQLFKRVRNSVARETQQAQIPWDMNNLTGTTFCFRTDTNGGCSSLSDDTASGAGEK